MISQLTNQRIVKYAYDYTMTMHQKSTIDADYCNQLYLKQTTLIIVILS